MKKQKKNSHEGITWSEMGKQNVQAEKVYSIPKSTAYENKWAWVIFRQQKVRSVVLS